MLMIKRDWRHSAVWWGLGLAYMILLTHMSLSVESYARPDVEGWATFDKFLHVMVYLMPAFGFAALWGRQLPVVLFLGLYGILMEFFQAAGGVREYQYSDMFCNLVGAWLGAFISIKYGRDWLWKLDQKF